MNNETESVKLNDKFKAELAQLLNTYSMDVQSSTPDYILADYLTNCLENYNTACGHKWQHTEVVCANQVPDIQL